MGGGGTRTPSDITPGGPLPELYLVTPEPGDRAAFPAFLDRLSAVLSSGVTLVQLRAKTLDAGLYAELAGEALRLCRERGARLILNGPVSVMNQVGAHGVHLSSARLAACAARPLCAAKIVSAACHNLADLKHAEGVGVDFVTLSPVLPTLTHPDAQPLGWQRFAELAASVPIPVFALGGLARDQLALAKAHGAHGIAAIRGIWPAA